MHRYRHAHNANDIWNCPECVDKGKLPANVDSRKYPSPKPIRDTALPPVTRPTSPQFNGADFAGQFETPRGIITATAFEIPGYRVEKCMGTVVGMSTRSRGFFPVLGASFKTIVGGDIGALTKLMYRTRNDAVSRLCAECQRLGANAVVGMRFDTGQIAEGIAQACVYGTAMYIVKECDGTQQAAGLVEKDENSQHWG